MSFGIKERQAPYPKRAGRNDELPAWFVIFGHKNPQIEKGIRKQSRTRFADLPFSSSIDLSRQGKRTLGAVMREIGYRPAHAGFLYSRIHGPVGLKRTAGSKCSLLFFFVNYAQNFEQDPKICAKNEKKVSISPNFLDKKYVCGYNMEESNKKGEYIWQS